VPLSKPIEGYESVATWARGLREQWGGDPLAEEPEKLETLAAFCEFFERDPDELVAFCFLRRRATGERFASVKRREEVASGLRRFRDERGLSGTAGRRLVADVLSFLIHNGVMMNPGAV
jgi:hypothetical protein